MSLEPRAYALALSNLVVIALAAGACVPATGEGDAGPSGPSWQLPLEGERGALLSVTGTASDDVWIVGADRRDGTGPTILHYTGDGFEREVSGDEGDLWWVSLDPTTGDAWMSGDRGRIFRRDADDATYEAMSAPDETRLYGVFPFAPDDVWAVGGDEAASAGVIWHYDGTTWTRPAGLDETLTEDLVFFKVWGSAPDDVWIVGFGGAAIHYDGDAFTRVELPVSRPVFTVHGGGGVVVGVGGVVSGLVVEEQGDALLDKTPAGAPQLNGVYVSDDGHAVAAGYEGEIWHRSAAGAWTRDEAAPTTMFGLSYHAVYEDPDGGIWAVGGFLDAAPLQQGMLAHYGDAISPEIR